MRLIDSPPPVTVPFAQNGNRNVIPVPSQIGVTKGAASYNDGFPPLTMTSPLMGGIPPFGQDMNGILFALSQIARWLMSGGTLVYNAAFATDPDIGGYPAGAVLLHADGEGFWLNTQDNNETDPDATSGGAAGWVSLNADWNATEGPGLILNRPTLARVATSGQYSDLSGSPPAPVNADWDAASGLAQILNRPDLASVATTGSYNDLVDTPDIPAAQVNSDWNATGGVAQILNRPDLARVATTGNYADLIGEPVFTTPPQFDNSTDPATSAFVQRALGSFSGQVTFAEDTALDATHAGMAIQWSGADGGTITLAPTSTLPLNAIAFLIYNHGAGVLNLATQGSDFIWMGGPSELYVVALQRGEFALCVSRVNGEYDVLVTRLPVNADWNATSGAAEILNRPVIPAAQVNADWNADSGVAEILNKPSIPAAQVNADWNATSGVAQILNKPAQLAALPVLTIELGHTAQENGGLGIDKGSWYQYDFNVGGNNPINGFEYTVNPDGTIVIESGVYLVSGSVKIIPHNGAPDTYSIPAQLTLATGQNYGFPGIYQYAIQYYPTPALGNASGQPLGTISLCGVMPSWSPSNPLWLGFSKVPGSNGAPLQLQGYLSYVKIG